MKLIMSCIAAIVAMAFASANASAQRVIFAVNTDVSVAVDYNQDLGKVWLGDSQIEPNKPQIIPVGNEVTLVAVPNSSSEFFGWKKGEEIFNTDAEYTFKPLHNAQITAVFEVTPTITTNEASVDGTTATLSGTMQPETTAISECGVYYSQSEFTTDNLPDNPATATFSDNTISANLTNLESGKTYFYMLYAKASNNKVVYGEVKTFETFGITSVVLNIPTENDIQPTYNTITGSYVTTGYSSKEVNVEIYSDETKDFVINADKSPCDASIAENQTFSADNVYFTPGLTTYVRAKVTIGTEVKWSDDIEVTTPIGFKVKTTKVTEKQSVTPTLSGEYERTPDFVPSFSNDGGCGVLYVKADNYEEKPETIAGGSEVTEFKVEFNGHAEFSVTITETLEYNTKYYYCTFAKDYIGNYAYGQVEEFTTEEQPISIDIKSFELDAAATPTSAKLKGSYEITPTTAENVEVRVYYSETQDFEINGETSSVNATGTAGTNVTSFTAELTDLTPNKTYYAKAMVKIGEQSEESSELKIETPLGFEVITTEASTYMSTTPTLKGTIRPANQQAYSPSIQERGILYLQSDDEPNSMSEATTVAGSGEDNNISATISSSLEVGKKYYYCAYAKDSYGNYAYGQVEEFTTIDGSISITDFSTTIAETSDTVIVKFSYNGEANILEDDITANTMKGVYYAESEIGLDNLSEVTTACGGDITQADGNYTYTVKLTSLEKNTTYYLMPLLNVGGIAATVDSRYQNITCKIEEVAQTFPKTGNHNGYDYVDLGDDFDVMWATTNFSTKAMQPTESGYYYQWGATSNFFDNDYSAPSAITKENDAVAQNWKDDWCMPTKADFDMLVNDEKTSWSVETIGEVTGMKIVAKGSESNYIFLPAAGGYDESGVLTSENEICSYWCTDYDESQGKPFALQVMIEEAHSKVVSGNEAKQALTIRPVLPKVEVTDIRYESGSFSATVKSPIYRIEQVTFEYRKSSDQNSNYSYKVGDDKSDGLYSAEVSLNANTGYFVRIKVKYKKTDGTTFEKVFGEEKELSTAES